MIEKSVKQVRNNCEIIRRLAQGGLDEKEMGDIAESLASGKTLDEIRAGERFADIFENIFGSGSARPR